MFFQGLDLYAPETAYSKGPKYAVNKAVGDIALFFEFAHPFYLLAVQIVQKYLKKAEKPFA